MWKARSCLWGNFPGTFHRVFVQGDSQVVKDDIRSRRMDFEGPDFEQDGPWGYRHQINIADSGFGSRRPTVGNDRAGEAGRELGPEDFDLEAKFGEEGVAILHLSGLV